MFPTSDMQKSRSRRGSVSSTNRFPAEVLCRIFADYLLDSDAVALDRTDLRLVCRFWNDIVISNPSLWTCIVVPTANLPWYSSDKPDAVFAGTSLALQRSKNLPIEVIIVFPAAKNYSNSFTNQHIPILCDLLAPHWSRTIRLQVAGANPELQEMFWDGIRGVRMPLLRILQHFFLEDSPGAVYKREAYDDPAYITPLAVDLDADEEKYPALQIMQIETVRCDWFSLPIYNLTCLHLGNQPKNSRLMFSTLQQMLTAMADKLQALNLEECFLIPRNTTSIVPVILPSLTQLRLAFWRGGKRVAFFVRTIEVPALVFFYLTDQEAMEHEGRSEPHELILRQKNTPAYGDDLFISLLEHLPLFQLEYLRLDWVVFSDMDAPLVRPGDILQGRVSESDLPISLRFVQALVSLKHLVVRDPTSVFLFLINYPIYGPGPLRLNLPSLESLVLQSGWTGHVCNVLQYRARVMPYSLDSMMVLGSLESWMEDFAAEAEEILVRDPEIETSERRIVGQEALELVNSWGESPLSHYIQSRLRHRIV